MIAVRPAVPADRDLIQNLVRDLSPRTRYLRFFNGMRELAPYWLERFASADPLGDFTLFASQAGTPVAMAQYSANPYPERCEVGKTLVGDLIAVAGAAGFERIEGEVLHGISHPPRPGKRPRLFCLRFTCNRARRG